MYLSAYVKDKKTKETKLIIRETYTSKEKFAKDIRNNGFAVIRISNKQDIAAQDCNYKTFAEMKKFSYNEDKIAEIEKIKL